MSRPVSCAAGTHSLLLLENNTVVAYTSSGDDENISFSRFSMSLSDKESISNVIEIASGPAHSLMAVVNSDQSRIDVIGFGIDNDYQQLGFYGFGFFPKVIPIKWLTYTD